MSLPTYVPTYPEIQALQGVFSQLGVLFVHREGRYRDNKNYQTLWLNSDRAVFIFHEDGRFKELSFGEYDDEGNYLPPEFYLEEPEVEAPEDGPEDSLDDEVSDPDDGEDSGSKDLLPLP